MRLILSYLCLFLACLSFVTSQEYLVAKYEATILSQGSILWYFSRYINYEAFQTQNVTPSADLASRMDRILLPGLLVMYDFAGNKIHENANLTKVLSTEDNSFVPTSDGGFLHFYIPLVGQKYGVLLDRYDRTMTKVGEPVLLPNYQRFSVAKGSNYIVIAGIGVRKDGPYVGITFIDLNGKIAFNETVIARNIYNASLNFQPSISVVPSPNRFFMVSWASKSASGDNVLRANYFSSPDGLVESRGFIIATAEKTKVVDRTDFLMINKCSLLKAGDGHVCVYDYIVIPSSIHPGATITRYTYSTLFSSTGSQFDLPTLLGSCTVDISKGVGLTRAVVLPYGGVLLISNTPIRNKQGVLSYVHLYDRTWESAPFDNTTIGPVGVVAFANNSVVSLNSNTAATGEFYVSPSFKALLANPSKFLNQSVYGNNPIIRSTFPEQDAQTQMGTPQNFSLTFIQSNYTTLLGNITIYDASRPDFPRQIIPVSSDSLVKGDTFTFNVYSFALNLPETKYYITVDGGTFQSAVWEPLEGLSSYQWRISTLNTGQSKDEKDDITVQIALVMSSTLERSQVATDLTKELVEALPIEPERISTSFLRQDTSGDIYQITIKKVTESQNRTATRIVQDFQNMMKVKARSPLSAGVYMQALNSEFGLTVETDLFRSNRDKFIILACVVVALVLTFLILQRKFPTSDNAILFVVAISLFDFCTDLLFVILNSGDIRSLRAPSAIFFVVPFCFNMLSSTYIIVKEVARNPLFHEWFTHHTLTTSTVTVLAATNPAIIFILSSRFCNLNGLNAPLSPRIRYQIMICVGLGILIEDIPQLVIQVIYKSFNGFFKLVPFLAVLSNCTGVIYSIVSQIYNYLAWKHEKKSLEISKRESKQHLSLATPTESVRIPDSILTQSSDNFRYSRSWVE